MGLVEKGNDPSDMKIPKTRKTLVIFPEPLLSGFVEFRQGRLHMNF